MTMPITFDKYGRMRYHPDFHENHGKPMTTSDRKFLIENYETMGPEQCSLALGRTIEAIYAYATNLRRQGLMPKCRKRTKHKREIRPNNV